MSDSNFDLDDIRILNKTREVRESIVGQLFANGKFPEDSSSRAALLATLDSLDRTTLAKAKIKAEDKSSKANQAIAASIAQVLIQTRNAATGTRTEAPVLPNTITVDSPVAGETDIGVHDLNYNDFIKANEGK